jgi:predicted dithiol-disulfide oxidoreductase (DUF899 family)
MNLPNIVSRAQWRAAREEFLAKEKEFSKARDRLNAERRGLPMVRIDKDYVFDGPDGEVTLLDLFEGRRQLIVCHFMLTPGSDYRCKACSMQADNIGHLAHLHARDTSLVMVSRAPLSEIQPFKERMGWTVPWFSSFNSDFNYDFQVTLDEEIAPVEYNYRSKENLLLAGMTSFVRGDQPGVSTFLRVDDDVFHTYSTYGRGLDLLVGTYNYLDLTALGRQEDWEEPPGRSNSPAQEWARLHDLYDSTSH